MESENNFLQNENEIKQWLRAHNIEDTNINSLRFREEYQNYLYKNKE